MRSKNCWRRVRRLIAALLNRRTLLPFACAALALSAGSVAHGQNVPNRAAEIFEQVCVDGGGNFQATDIEPAQQGDIPRKARNIAMVTLWGEEFDHRRRSVVESHEMPSGIFRIAGEDEIFLMVPDERPTNPVQNSCAVFISGNKYEELATYAAALTSNELPDLEEANWKVAFQFGANGVAVAINPQRGTRWTMIATSPLQ